MCEIVSVDGGAPAADCITTTVVSAMAAIEDVEPLELDVALGDYFDADALELLLDHAASADSDVRVSLSLEDYDILVESSGHVVLSKPCGGSDRRPGDE
jgi:hypothetical protein